MHDSNQLDYINLRKMLHLKAKSEPLSSPTMVELSQKLDQHIVKMMKEINGLSEIKQNL